MKLVYLYVGSADVGADLELYKKVLEADVVWDISSGGTRVAALRLGPENNDSPLWLLADHRPPKTVIPIWAVDAIDPSWKGHRVELPDGPCLLMTDPSGNQIGLLHQTRPGIPSTPPA